nr:transposase domain-containing protein [Escherichia coli]
MPLNSLRISLADYVQLSLQAGFIQRPGLNGIDPEAYLRHILSVLPEWPSNRVDELLPWNVVLTNK